MLKLIFFCLALGPVGIHAAAEPLAFADSGTMPGTPAHTAAPVAATTAKIGNAARIGGLSASNSGVSDEYRIGEGDVIQISVWGEPTASVASVIVRSDGRITVPLIKDVLVAGLTPAEAEKVITDKLAGDINSPDVTVIVSQSNSKKIFVIGAVRKQGPIPYTYRMTIMQAISEAGGLTEFAKARKIYVLRTERGEQHRLPFDYDAALKGRRLDLNISLKSGDMLVVPQ